MEYQKSSKKVENDRPEVQINSEERMLKKIK